MKLPPPFLDSPFFLFSDLAEFSKALGEEVRPEEMEQIQALVEKLLPPVTSRYTLATMFGINPGLIWSMENRTHRYYRSFTIPKGQTVRRIDAPKVALKIIQKWLSVQLERLFVPPQHVFGFISGRSHIQAAAVHTGARWVFSVDIRNFFPTTPEALVRENLERLGFTISGACLLARLSCLRGALAQGAPTSPALSNICFNAMDAQLADIANDFSVRVSRYADDIVFSGTSEFPTKLQEAVSALFESTTWVLAEEKTELARLPQRLKVHGLLVHGNVVRLTKGYRHRLRAYRHLLAKGAVGNGDLKKVIGHLSYGDYIERLNSLDED
ncbi:MAG: RNA-directed DNA polymerase [Pseudomonadota bacterium]|nr:RNA-directed DNA polymerase [Pseudomonadota bacterium]